MGVEVETGDSFGGRDIDFLVSGEGRGRYRKRENL